MFSGMGSEFHALKSLKIPFKHVFACEDDKYAQKFIKINNITENIFTRDLEKMNIKLLPRVDVFLCSPPCQGMSKIGSRQHDDPRNQLYKIPLRYARLKKPKIFILENVPQFIKMHAFKGFIHSLKRIYKFVKYQILDSSHYGSIQARKRLFTIAKNSDFDFPVPKAPRPK